ncbi:hypothetical protein Hanom_Chr06g00507381 [Helianthus anomalus]
MHPLTRTVTTRPIRLTPGLFPPPPHLQQPRRRQSLGPCSSVSRRFHSLVPQVQNVVVRVDCVNSEDDPSSSSNSSDKSSSISTLFRILIEGIFKPIQALGQFLGPKRSSPPATSPLSSWSTSSLSIVERRW